MSSSSPGDLDLLLLLLTLLLLLRLLEAAELLLLLDPPLLGDDGDPGLGELASGDPGPPAASSSDMLYLPLGIRGI